MKRLFQLALLVLVSAQAGAQYNSLLWKISGNGLKEPSYLFGTMHTADARIVYLGDKIAGKHFAACPTFAMELDPGDKELNVGMLSKLMMGNGYSLAKMIPDKEYRFLDSMASKTLGYPMYLFDNVAPIVVMTILESMSMGLSDSSVEGNTQVLDVYFYNKAKESKKKIIGIETVEEQLNALRTLKYEDQAELLTQEIDSFSSNKDGGKEVLQYYLNQNLDSLAAMDDDAKKPEKFYKALVTDRNERMANRIGAFIKKQPAFVAIGALHLPGDKGVIALLREKGYKVEAVKD
jgi:uncharacterized protein YbaP (TraB family)